MLRWRKQTTTGWQSLGPMRRSCSSPARRWHRVLAKRMHGKSATMVLMVAGSELDPVFGSLAPVIAFTYAVWDRWMPLATMAKGVRKAQLEQRENARPWTAVKGPSGAAVATLARMQWTILEHDPFLWCMHDGRIVDPRRVCPHSVRVLLNNAARAWQWRRVALHEGYEGLSCGAVVAPLFAALCSSRLSAHEQFTCARLLLTGSGLSSANIVWRRRCHRCVRSLAAKKAV